MTPREPATLRNPLARLRRLNAALEESRRQRDLAKFRELVRQLPPK